MNKLIIAAILVTAITGAANAQEFSVGPEGFGFHEHHRHWEGGPRRWHPGGGHWEHRGGQCRELRAACMHKEELGEEGQGNCRRYRESCQ